ncbi:protein FAM136A-like [Fopius arisanus]|uniref:Protein FAM136A-like n=1 Tax=Fopius arisanus TaxID=64838 RepID=A0A9R1TNV1_9HYME|nr:PREDICTED: protein FAM136A-like [Fopius arisanus]
MVEEQRRRVEDQMTKVVEEIDKSHLRRLQGDMHRCAATCCDNKTASVQKIHQCIQNCSGSLTKAQQHVNAEFTRFQNRLQRCIMDCNDHIKDQMGVNPTQNEVNRLTDGFEHCATKCVDIYCDLIPSLEKTMKDVLTNGTIDGQS